MNDKFRKMVLLTLEDFLVEQLDCHEVAAPGPTAQRLLSEVDFALQSDNYPYQDKRIVGSNARIGGIAFGEYEHPMLAQHIGADVDVFYGDDCLWHVWVKLPDEHFIVARSVR